MEAGAPGELDRARVELLRAQIAFASTHGSDAPTMLLEAARRLTPLSPILAYETYLDALSAAMFAGRLAVPGASVPDVALAAKAAPRPPVLGGPELLLEGSRPFSARATRLRPDPAPGAERVRRQLAARERATALEVARDRLVRPRVGRRPLGGDLRTACADRPGDRCAWRASVRVEPACLRASFRGGADDWGIVELIEAAVRAGTPELAAGACSRLAEMARASGTDWALGVAARSDALLAEDQRAEELYVEAVDRLGRSRIAVDLARAHLLYGEWLRRQRRRIDARGQLRTAHDLFSNFGMEAFGERTRVELEATGEHAGKRTVDTLGQLTPQEAQISRLVAQGNTTREIAAQLFISPSTVEYHLRKAFRKLGVKSRTQLARRMV
jgi:DNA-binding CsgD family transcriptional regulator